MNEILKRIYYDPSNSASFSSIDKLFDEAKKQINYVTKKDVKKFLLSQNTYTLHRQKRKNFLKNQVIAEYPNEQFEADLVDMIKFSKNNNGYKYILTCIDVFSKFAFAIPLKDKSGLSLSNAFKKIFKKSIPQKLYTDKGKEFLNNNVQKVLEDHKVNHFTSKNDVKCTIVERFNKTLKSKMWKFFTSRGNTKWFDKLDVFVNSYNNSQHSSTKFKPIEINNENSNIVFRNLYGFNSYRELLKSFNTDSKLLIDDKVRIPYKANVFEKSYYPNWQDTIYTIENITKSNKKPFYKLRLEKNKIKKRFYPEEIQKVIPEEYRVEKIIKSKSVRGQKYYLVKWLGYSEEYNSWEPAENIRKL
ncbi:MAG: DDE-type integrase/transposase/recombinase [Limnohabitans sp.]|nr:DDE-type integrase/transposase/recombinase [Limnohabitans sp.]